MALHRAPAITRQLNAGQVPIQSSGRCLILWVALKLSPVSFRDSAELAAAVIAHRHEIFVHPVFVVFVSAVPVSIPLDLL